MQICSLACRILSLVGGAKVPERCWQTGAGTDRAIFYISEDWTGWLMRRFKGLKTCHWLSNEVEIKYHNFTNALVERCKTKGKSWLVTSGLHSGGAEKVEGKEEWNSLPRQSIGD